MYAWNMIPRLILGRMAIKLIRWKFICLFQFWNWIFKKTNKTMETNALIHPINITRVQHFCLLFKSFFCIWSGKSRWTDNTWVILPCTTVYFSLVLTKLIVRLKAQNAVKILLSHLQSENRFKDQSKWEKLFEFDF